MERTSQRLFINQFQCMWSIIINQEALYSWNGKMRNFTCRYRQFVPFVVLGHLSLIPILALIVSLIISCLHSYQSGVYIMIRGFIHYNHQVLMIMGRIFCWEVYFMKSLKRWVFVRVWMKVHQNEVYKKSAN